MKVKKDINLLNGKTELLFTEFNENDVSTKIKSHCEKEGIEITNEQLAESLKDWQNDVKSNIKLANGYNLYHLCRCYSISFAIFYNKAYSEFKKSHYLTIKSKGNQND